MHPWRGVACGAREGAVLLRGGRFESLSLGPSPLASLALGGLEYRSSTAEQEQR